MWQGTNNGTLIMRGHNMYIKPETMTARRKAIKDGAITYLMDKPCPQGHMTSRYVSSHGCIACTKIHNATFRRANHRFQHYGVKREQWEHMLKEQKGVCYICGNAPGKHGLHVDHNHKTGKVRALLCGPCNTKVGFWEDVNRDIYERYLKETV